MALPCADPTIVRRFFVPRSAIEADQVTVTGPEAHHIATVLRLETGARVTVFDGSGAEYLVELDRVSPDGVSGRILGRSGGSVPAFRLTLVQGVPKGAKMDAIIRMGTELGIAEFVPVRSARSVATAGGRVQRWRRIAAEAAKQSRRADVPVVHDTMPFAESLALLSSTPLRIVLWEGEENQTLAGAIEDRPAPDRAALIVGPEGGLEAAEVAGAVAAGAIPASLGPLILRTETAGVVAAAMLFYEFGLRRSPRSGSGRL